MNLKLGILSAMLLASTAVTSPLIAAPPIKNVSIAPKAEVVFWRFQGGCFVLYAKTYRLENGKMGPPGYERNVPIDYECLFSI